MHTARLTYNSIDTLYLLGDKPLAGNCGHEREVQLRYNIRGATCCVGPLTGPLWGQLCEGCCGVPCLPLTCIVSLLRAAALFR
jgi:hypothetical protein